MGKLRRPELPPGPLNELVRELHVLHVRAGRPSTREMARGQGFSYTAVHDLFTKTVDEPPRLPILLKVVSMLTTLDPRADPEATLDRFDALWSAAANEQATRPATADESPAEPVHLEAYEHDMLVMMAQGKRVEEIMPAFHMTSGAVRAISAALRDKLGAVTHDEIVERARDLGLINSTQTGHTEPPPPPERQRAFTKELFFLGSNPEAMHDAAAELRRAGFLVRDQPRDLGGTWSLMAYSASTDLSDDDLATLDDIAERCGVDFDGTGTYVGPPHMDDGPGKAPTTTEPLFSVTGEVLTTSEAVTRMHNLGIGRTELIRRHTSGDWGEISADDAEANDLALQTGNDQIMSGYGQGEQRLLVITEADRSVTTILTPEDL